MLKAIDLFNKAHKDKDLAIVDETHLYKVKLSKKSGLPDMDLPAIHETSELKKLNCLNFSIVVEDHHIVIVPKARYSVSTQKKNINSNNESIFSSSKQKFCELSKTEPLLEKNKKNNCCACFKRFFNKIK